MSTVDYLDPFGPITVPQQINAICNMFDIEARTQLRPIIGRVVKSYGYDAALFAFTELKEAPTPPANVWAFVMALAKRQYFEAKEASAKAKWAAPKLSIIDIVDELVLQGLISLEEVESITTEKDAMLLLERKGIDVADYGRQ